MFSARKISQLEMQIWARGFFFPVIEQQIRLALSG